MSVKGFRVVIGSVFGGVATLATIVGINLKNVDELFEVPQLSAAQRTVLGAEVRRAAADGLVSADERIVLDERLAALDTYEESAAAYVAEIEPAMLAAANELREGIRLATSARFADARRRFAEAARLDPGHAAAWANLGGAALEVGSIAEAEAASRRALELDAKSVTAHYNLGACLARQERLEVAIDHLSRALDLVIDGSSKSVDRKSLLADLRGSPHFAPLRSLPQFTELVRRLEHAEG
jgi:tetratricopeptide (TPR) repeat protein